MTLPKGALKGMDTFSAYGGGAQRREKRYRYIGGKAGPNMCSSRVNSSASSRTAVGIIVGWPEGCPVG